MIEVIPVSKSKYVVAAPDPSTIDMPIRKAYQFAGFTSQIYD